VTFSPAVAKIQTFSSLSGFLAKAGGLRLKNLCEIQVVRRFLLNLKVADLFYY